MSDSPLTIEPASPPQAEPPIQAPKKLSLGLEVHWIVLCFATVVLVIAALLSVDGETQVDLPFIGGSLPTLCHMKRFTGLDCPGCGLTRCFISLAHGNMTKAWHFNPAGILVFMLVAVQLPYRAAQIWRLKQGLPEFEVRRISSVFIALMVSALVLQWVWKLLQLAMTWNG